MSEIPPGPEAPRHTTPRWVKVFIAVAIAAIVVIVIVLLIAGPEGHGPGRHLPGGRPLIEPDAPANPAADRGPAHA